MGSDIKFLAVPGQPDQKIIEALTELDRQITEICGIPILLLKPPGQETAVAMERIAQAMEDEITRRFSEMIIGTAKMLNEKKIPTTGRTVWPYCNPGA